MSSPAEAPASPFEAVGRGHRLPPELRCYGTTRADHGCQPRTRVRRRRIARIDFDLSRAKLTKGVELEKVLDYNAPGSATVQAEYQRRYGGKPPCRDTIIEDHEALYGQPTGRLRSKYSHHARREVQATTYSLRHIHRTLGSKGSKLMSELINFAYSLEVSDNRRPPHGDVAVSRNYVQGAVRIALDRAVNGAKHITGLKLAWYLANLGVPEDDAWEALRDYWTEVRPLGGRRYEWREARKAVQSAYKKVGGR